MGNFKFFYSLYGLVIGSELELPELAPLPTSAVPDVVIRLGILSADLGLRPTSHPFLYAADDGPVLVFRDVGRFLMVGGSTISIESVDPGNHLVRAILYGPVMSIVCLQHGLVPLHASAVAFGHDVIAFCGDAGAGKSTLAAHCLERGATLVTDDLLILSMGTSGTPRVQPGIPMLKLWRDAVHGLGRTTEGLAAEYADEEKYYVPVDHSAAIAELTLSTIYMLHEDDAAGAGVVTPIVGATAVAALQTATFVQHAMDLVRARRAHFANCVQLATAVPLMRLSRRRDVRWLPETARQFSQGLLACARSETRRLMVR